MHRIAATLALMCLVLGPLGAFARILPPLAGFAMFAASGPLGLVALVWGVVVWQRRRQRSALVSALLGVVPVVVLLIPIAGAAGYPRINDISTDAVDPPVLSQAPTYPASFREAASRAYRDLRPLVLPAAPRLVFAEALALARSQPGWTVTAADEDAMTFTAVAETQLFHFQDDVAVRVRASMDGEAVVDMRSRSRQGKGDLGANAGRIRAFLRELEARVSGG